MGSLNPEDFEALQEMERDTKHLRDHLTFFTQDASLTQEERDAAQVILDFTYLSSDDMEDPVIGGQAREANDKIRHLLLEH